MTKWFSLRGLSIVCAVLICFAFVALTPHRATALGGQNGVRARVMVNTNEIFADSSPFHLEWDGSRGSLTEYSLTGDAPHTYALTFLHTDVGPAGYAKHLAWFLARDGHSFSLLWCYFNDTGHEFWCWIYRYPSNLVTTLRFQGSYHFTAPVEPAPEVTQDPFHLDSAPGYVGPNFTFEDWTRHAGTLTQLKLRAAAAPALNATPATPLQDSGVIARTLSGLKVSPLHEIKVGSSNGWRDQGWRELHALATDANGDPYYLILYSNATIGYVVDLKHAQTFTANFGLAVNFAKDSTSFNTSSSTVETDTLTEIFVKRFDKHEVMLSSSQTHANPYTDVTVDVDVRTPNGDKWSLQGYWDGGSVWRVRITPTMVGTWTWHIISTDPDLHDRQGAFECVTDSGEEKGFVHVNPSYPRHFADMNGTPFYPSILRMRAHSFTTGGGSSLGQTAPSGDEAMKPEAALASFAAFQKQVDTSAALGVNVWAGGILLDEPAFSHNQLRNEGGAPFIRGDLDQLNPAFFQWMDRRIAYCNEKGIVPTLGLGWPGHGLFANYTALQLRVLWRYMLARYGAYNVIWNLFGHDATPYPEEANLAILEFGNMTRHLDPYQHPLSVMTTDPALPKAQSGPVVAADSGASVAPRHRRDRPVAPPRPTPALYANERWMDVIWDYGTDITNLIRNWSVEKPLLWWDALSGTSASSPSAADTIRHHLWEARMNGAYWTATADSSEIGQSSQLSPETSAMLACATFFKQTRYWRLIPHPDLIGKPVETFRRWHPVSKVTADTAPKAPGLPDDAGLPPRPGGRGFPGSPTQSGAPIFPVLPSAPGLAELPGGPAQTRNPIGPTPSTPPTRPEEATKSNSSLQWLLADPGWEYVLYFPEGGVQTLDLLEATGQIKVAWFNPRTGQFVRQETISGGSYVTFATPDKNDWVLYISRR